jgi:hypothetical protein
MPSPNKTKEKSKQNELERDQIAAHLAYLIVQAHRIDHSTRRPTDIVVAESSS